MREIEKGKQKGRKAETPKDRETEDIKTKRQKV